MVLPLSLSSCFVATNVHGGKLLPEGSVELIPSVSCAYRNPLEPKRPMDAIMLLGGHFGFGLSQFVNIRGGYQYLTLAPGIVDGGNRFVGKKGNVYEVEPVFALKKNRSSISCAFALSSADSLYQIVPGYFYTHTVNKYIDIHLSQKACGGFFLNRGLSIALNSNVGIQIKPTKTSPLSLLVFAGCLYSYALFQATASVSMPIVVVQ